jgi:hypothetical protein
VEPRPLPLQHQLPALEHRRSRPGESKNQSPKATGARLPERQDDLCALRAGPFERHVEHLNAVAHSRNALRADQHHLVRVLRPQHRIHPRGHQRFRFVDTRGPRDVVIEGIERLLAGKERDDLGRLPVLETQWAGNQRGAAGRIRVGKDPTHRQGQERNRKSGQETRKAPGATTPSRTDYPVEA